LEVISLPASQHARTHATNQTAATKQRQCRKSEQSQKTKEKAKIKSWEITTNQVLFLIRIYASGHPIIESLLF
jgi:hypothetical protein